MSKDTKENQVIDDIKSFIENNGITIEYSPFDEEPPEEVNEYALE